MPSSDQREPDKYSPTDREPLPSGLIPAERLALTVARAQIERGDNPPANVTTVLVMTIDRLLGGPGQCIKINEPRPHAFTRDELVHALKAAPVTGTLEMLESQGGVPEDLADAIIQALDSE